MLEEGRARIDVEVPADRLGHDIDHTLGHLSTSVRIPGFRKGKVPPQVVLQRLGREEVLEETMREHLMRWYTDALEEVPLHPVGRPEIDFDELPREGEPFRFNATVHLRPKGSLPEPLAIEAPRAEVSAPADEIDRELERLRVETSPLRAVEGRPARTGDFVELDFSASIGGKPVKGTSALGYHAELGSGRLLEEIERGVLGMAPGERKQIEVDFPSDYPNSAFKGKTVVFDVELRALQERDVRPLDDAFAKDASEFDDLNALRADVAETLTGRLRREADAAYRSEVLTALGRAVDVDLPEELTADKTDELLLSLARGFARRGVSLAAWLRQTGKTPDDARAELRDEAVDTLKKEIALEAFADREGITVDDDQLQALVLEDAQDAGLDDAENMVQEVLSSPSKESVREDVRLRLALDRAVEIAKPISLEQAEARDKLWTPEKDDSEKPKPQLWTPGQPR